MTLDSKTPLALYKANLELVLRLGTLLQENRRRWTRLGAASASDAIERTMAETERVLTANDWTSLAALPGEEFWKSIRGEAGPLRESIESAVSHQAAFAKGLQDAFDAWRQQSADALGAHSVNLPAPSLADFMKSFTSPATRASAAPANKSSGKPAARKKPAAARKAAANAPVKGKPRSGARK
jgi:hypothetical protein